MADDELDNYVQPSLLKAMELVDSSESESEDDEYRKIMLFTSTKRNLSDELEACVSSQEKVVPMEQAQQVKPKKIKRGPELQIARTRRNKNDTRTVMQKSTELKCIQNLEAPTKGAGNSFVVLDSQ